LIGPHQRGPAAGSWPVAIVRPPAYDGAADGGVPKRSAGRDSSFSTEE